MRRTLNTSKPKTPSSASTPRTLRGSLLSKLSTLAVALVALALSGCQKSRTARLSSPPPKVVAHVDLKKYAGKWYEIARLPNRFQSDCMETSATYTLRDDGEVTVLNECRKGSAQGELDTIEGNATVADASTNAKLKVSFFWPFSGDYWILALGENYEYAVVGAPSRDYAWILSRSPEMDGRLYETLVNELREQGFDAQALIKTTQAKKG